MIIAAPLYPAVETPEAVQVEAGGLIKMVLGVGHKVHQTCFSEGLNPRPFCILKGGNGEVVVDPEDMIQVLLPTTNAKFHHQSRRIMEGRPWRTSSPRLGSFWCWWWWNTGHRPGGQIALLMRRLCTRLPRHTSGATDGSATASLPSCARSSTVLFCGGI